MKALNPGISFDTFTTALNNLANTGYKNPDAQEIVGYIKDGKVSRTPTTSVAPVTNPSVNNSNNFLNNTFTFDDPELQTLIESLPVEMQGVIGQIIRNLQKTIEDGKQLNPNIDLTPERLKEFLDQATTELEPYYQEIFNQSKQDIELSLNRLSEDYNKTINRAEQPFRETLANQSESEAQAGLTYGSERGTREQQTVQNQQRSLDDLFTNISRGVQDTVTAGERSLGSGILSGIQTPQFSPVTANTQGFQVGSPRNLSTLQGNLIGTIPKEKETMIQTRASDLEDIYRRNRILDISSLS